MWLPYLPFFNKFDYVNKFCKQKVQYRAPECIILIDLLDNQRGQRYTNCNKI
jgi:hypothetical protein